MADDEQGVLESYFGSGDPAPEPEPEQWAPDKESWDAVQAQREQIDEVLQAAQQQLEGGYYDEQDDYDNEDEVPDQYADPEGYRAWIDEQINEQTAPLVEQFEQLGAGREAYDAERAEQVQIEAEQATAQIDGELNQFVAQVGRAEGLGSTENVAAIRHMADALYDERAEARRQAGIDENSYMSEHGEAEAVLCIQEAIPEIRGAYLTRRMIGKLSAPGHR